MNFKGLPIVSIIIVLFAQINSVLAVSDSVNVSQEVIGTCNENGVCEPGTGENSENCSADCLLSPKLIFGPDIAPPEIYGLLISITLDSADISWETNELALCQLFLGKTQEYEEETISEASFYLKHSTQLTHLSSGTVYYFKIKCRDTNRNESEIGEQKFTTLFSSDITPPANISGFKAIAGDGEIVFEWKNPPDPDFKAVKILRSEKFYPKDPSEGKLVYDGEGASFIDTGLKNEVRYYYTVFVYDKAGNYASGAIISVVPQKPDLPGVIPETSPEIFPGIPPGIPPELVLPEIEKLNLEDFNFVQEGKKLPVIEGEIEIKKGKPLTISVDYDKIPEGSETIIVSMEKGGKTFSFFLRIDKEKTAYSTTFMPPEETGTYVLTITVLDYKNQILKKITGRVVVSEIKILIIPWYKKINWLRISLILIASAVIFYLIEKFREHKLRKEKLKS